MKINGYRRLRGGYDVDDVKLKFAHGFLLFAADRLGRKIPYESFKNYHIGRALGMEGAEANALLDAFYRAGGLENLEPVEGAVEALSYLTRFADDFTLTARNVLHKDVTCRALTKHFVSKGIPFSEIHFCFNHNSLFGSEKKADAAVRLKLDYMVEDSPENSIEVAGKGIPVFLLRKPWNEDVKSSDYLTVCNDWSDVVAGVEKLRR